MRSLSWDERPTLGSRARASKASSLSCAASRSKVASVSAWPLRLRILEEVPSSLATYRLLKNPSSKGTFEGSPKGEM